MEAIVHLDQLWWQRFAAANGEGTKESRLDRAQELREEFLAILAPRRAETTSSSPRSRPIRNGGGDSKEE
jgi:hypothetical protein